MRDYSFGNFLHELRERRGLSQYQLGMLVGVSNKAVSKWENGSAKPQSRLLYKLGEVLGVTVDELLACKYRSFEEGNKKGIFAMKKQLWNKAYDKMIEKYGNAPSMEVLNRFESERAEMEHTDMIVYLDLLAQLTEQAKANGGHLRVTGGIGASFVAYLLGATEIHPLKPHYYCPSCHKMEFSENIFCGWDLPSKFCTCGEAFLRDGHNLPFETFRYALQKSIHFDLAVSQHLYPAVKNRILSYFADNNVVTLVRKDRPHFETYVILNGEISNAKNGQVLPFEEYFDKVKQYPAITVMIHEELNLYGLIEAETNTPFDTVPFTDPEVLEAFAKNETQGIPEFQTDFFQKMISEISPSSFHELIQIPGLAHGSGVWEDNAQPLFKEGVPIGKMIAYRDDVFHSIQEKMKSKNISNTGYAYKIMEDTRRGVYAKKGLSPQIKQQFSHLGIEAWFANSIERIKYVFPKAQGVLCVKYALILMWYKIHYPETFHRIMMNH